MKDNKGFTLIELIATIGIMLLIGIVIVNNMTGILSKQQAQDYESFKKELEESACVYVETKWSSDERKQCKSSNSCFISVDKLIEEGYIAENLKDPNTGELLDANYKVVIQWINDVKTCSLNK